jgi:hypothetical protein
MKNRKRGGKKKRLRMKREITKRITSMPVVVRGNRKRKKKQLRVREKEKEGEREIHNWDFVALLQL